MIKNVNKFTSYLLGCAIKTNEFTRAVEEASRGNCWQKCDKNSNFIMKQFLSLF